MNLDLPTLTMMGSFVSAAAGIALLAAWLQHRDIRALLLWSLANFVSAVGIALIGVSTVTKQHDLFVAGGAALSVGTPLVWLAARSLDAKWGPWWLCLGGFLAVGVLNAIPAMVHYAPPIALAVNAAYQLVAAWSLWSARGEASGTRWPIAFFTALHGLVFVGGMINTLDGTVGQQEVPPIASLFGVIYFESIVFSLSTAVFLLALVKDRAEKRALAAGRHDHLTGVANRGTFMEGAERVLERSRRDKSPVAVVMFDLDLFKRINDTYGHAVGDQVLVIFSEVASSAMRPQDLFGRIGGEEFAMVLPGCGIESGYVRADRIRARFAEICRNVGEHDVTATVSGGVAVGEATEETLATLLEFADRALYRAKAEGRNRIERAAQPRRRTGSSSVLRVA